MDTFLKTLMHHITIVMHIEAYLSEAQKYFFVVVGRDLHGFEVPSRF